MDMRIAFKTSLTEHLNDIGLWIDVFPLDGAPDNALMLKAHYLRLRFIWGWLQMLSKAPTAPRKSKRLFLIGKLLAPTRPLLQRIGPAWFCKKIDKLAMKYPFDQSKQCGCIYGGRAGLNELNAHELYEPHMKAMFVDREFHIPNGYDTYLRKLYGDYMQMPPEDQRVSHQATAWWKESDEYEAK